MRVAALLLLGIGCAMAAPAMDKDSLFGEFMKFMTKYGKKYDSTAEFQIRFENFIESVKKSVEHQAANNGDATFGVSKFADHTNEEISAMMGLRMPARHANTRNHDYALSLLQAGGSDLPASVDWRTKGAVTPVKNQGQCGSCWAFSAVANLEGQYAAKFGKLISLSEQFMMNCDKQDFQCAGGLPTHGVEIAMDFGAMVSEKEMPYNGDNEACDINAILNMTPAIGVHGAYFIPNNETMMAEIVAKTGPISIGINANPIMYYTGGIMDFSHGDCDPTQLDHGVAIVGYGVGKDKAGADLPYWIVKNSWGPDWGEKGFFRISRGKNTCGVANAASNALVNKLQ